MPIPDRREGTHHLLISCLHEYHVCFRVCDRVTHDCWAEYLRQVATRHEALLQLAYPDKHKHYQSYDIEYYY